MNSRVVIALVGAFLVGVLGGEGQAYGRSRSTIKVEVVDVAGGFAYLDVGEDKGIKAGTKVRFKKRGTYRVVRVSGRFSAVKDKKGRLRTGLKGTAKVRRTRKGKAGLVAPRPLGDFRGKWRKATKPADGQHPELVPLGAVVVAGQVQASLQAGTATYIPLDGEPESRHMTRVFLYSQLRADGLWGTSLGFDGDLGVSDWYGEGLSSDSGT